MLKNMPINRDNYTPVKDSEQNISNLSFDQEFQVTAVESLVYNPASGNLDRLSLTNPVYVQYDKADNDTGPDFEGVNSNLTALDTDPTWLITKYIYVGVEKTYTNRLPNETHTTYYLQKKLQKVGAWSGRATLFT